ncbi:MAG: type IV secretion system protein, partial [Candidatus Eremiobacteraeota bacterium]|nr:type IV secretion system protein [Candidatus Eremiobacteraeota bacterium]
MIRATQRFSFATMAFVALVAGAFVALPSIARAGGLPMDPLTTIQGEYASWITTAQGYAQDIYVALIIFEFIAIAITTLLFRENLGEFISSIGFKVLLGGIFFWFIAYGPNIAQNVIKMFTTAGDKFGGSGPDTVVLGFFTAAGLYFGAAGAAQNAAATATVAAGLPCVWALGTGTCQVGAVAALNSGHAAFILITQGLGLMIMLAAIAILLQFCIVSIESYLVMSVGILMIGFAGSRWTFGFSQGYFSYMINVGVKLMVTYIVLGVAANELVPIIATSAATLLIASAIPYGASDAVATGTAALSAVYVVLTAGLLWTIPAFTAALLSGQSQSSGAAILQQTLGSFAGATQAFAQFGAARHAGTAASAERAAMQDVQAHAAGAGGAANASALVSQVQSPARNVDASFASGGAQNAAAQNGGAMGGIGVGTGNGSSGPTMWDGLLPQQFVNPKNGQSFAPSYAGSSGGGFSLEGLRPGQIQAMPSAEFRTAMQNPDYARLDDSQRHAIAEYHASDAREILASRLERDSDGERFGNAFGMQG